MIHLFRTHRKSIAKTAATLTLLIGVSVLIEWFGFGYRLHTLPAAEQGLRTIPNTDIATEGFTLAEDEVFDSQTPNAILTIPTNGRYVNNLRVEYAPAYREYALSIEYTDPQTEQLVTIKPKVSSGLIKRHINTLPFLLFHIDNTPQSITLRASSANTSLSGIVIDNRYHFNQHRFLFIFAVLTLIAFFAAFRNTIGLRPEYAFLAIALICGSLIAFSEPHEYVSWDELFHYKRADNYSFKTLVPKTVSDFYSQSGTLPSSFSIEEQAALDQTFDTNFKSLQQKKASKEDEFSPLKFYQNLAHIPSGLALFFGRLLHIPAHIVFFLGRWVNIFVFSGIGFLAIRSLKSGKMLAAVIALLPTSIFLASNYGYDSWLTAFTLLGTALLFTELQQPDAKISFKKSCSIIGSFVIGLSAKAIYFPLLFLLFLLPKHKFHSREEYRRFLGIAILAIVFVLGSFIIPFLTAGQGGNDMRGGKDVNSSKQIHFILSDPIAYSGILARFITGYINPLNAESLTISFAYLGSIPGFAFILILFAAILLFDSEPIRRHTDTLAIRAAILIVFLATVSLVATALYVSFTPVRSPIINGVQGRYLIPLLFPILFIVGSHRLRNPLNKNHFNLIIFASFATILMNGIWTLITRLEY
jgi:uncharacterized membrane protein